MSKPAWQSQSFKKDAAPAVRKFADGGEAALKAEGLAADDADRARRDEGKSDWAKFKQGWKDLGTRFTEGNIDDPSSKAYWKSGAGRGQNERNAKALSDEAESMARAVRGADDRDDGSAFPKPGVDDRDDGSAYPVADDRDDGSAFPAASRSSAPRRAAARPAASGAVAARPASSDTRPPAQPATEAPTTPKPASGMKNTLAERQEAEATRRRTARQARSESRAAESAEGYKALNESMAAAKSKRQAENPPDTRTAAERSQARGRKLKAFLGLGD
jgi:hypothetical protein